MEEHRDLHGDFAEGERTRPPDEHEGSFADGEAEGEHKRKGSFADGEAEGEHEREGSFADSDET
jgi:hypothetical protein